MTINLQILRAMNVSYPRSNAGLSDELGRPEPSVRRATRMLTEQGLIKLVGREWGMNDYTLTEAGKRAARAGTL